MKKRLKRRRPPRRQELPHTEDTEFGEERSVHQAIQRAYDQSGVTEEPSRTEKGEGKII